MPFLSDLMNGNEGFGIYTVSFQPDIYKFETWWFSFLKSGKILKSKDRTDLLNQLKVARAGNDDEMDVDTPTAERLVMESYTYGNGTKPKKVKILMLQKQVIALDEQIATGKLDLNEIVFYIKKGLATWGVK